MAELMVNRKEQLKAPQRESIHQSKRSMFEQILKESESKEEEPKNLRSRTVEKKTVKQEVQMGFNLVLYPKKPVKLAVKEEKKVSEKFEYYEPANHKTVLCKWHVKFGHCTFPNCSFAHGEKELRSFKKDKKQKEEEKEEYYDEEEEEEEEQEQEEE